MVEMSFLETLKTFVPANELFKKNGLYLLCTNLKLRKIVNGKFTCEEELRNVLVEEVREQESNPNYHIAKKYWCPDDATFDEIRIRLESLSRKAEISHPQKRTIERHLDQQEKKRESWYYC